MEASEVGRSYVAEAVLLTFAVLTLGVLEPQLDVVNFDKLTVRQAVTDTATANPLNQMKWVALAAFASLLVLRAPTRLLHVAALAWPLGALLAFCLLSTLWSDHSDITLRRALGLMVAAYTLLVGIAYVDRPERAIVIVYLAFWSLLLVTLAVLPLPTAYDEFGWFRGSVGNKNALGACAAIAILLGLGIGPWLRQHWSKVMRLVFLAAWSGVLALTVSKTSMGLIVIVPVLFLALGAVSQLLRVPLGAVLIGTPALFALGLAICFAGAGYTPADLVRLVHADASFTGRTEIWDFMLREVGPNWLAGRGFGAFWGTGYDAPNLRSIHDYIQLLNQAHNGYLDILAALGVIGLCLLLLVIVHFAAAAERLRNADPALYRLAWFLMLFALLHNTMEGSFLVPFNMVWHMMLLAVLLVARSVEGGGSWAR